MAIARRRNLNLGAATALAAAGTSVADAAAIKRPLTIVSGADNAAGVVLPSNAKIGDPYWVYSSVSANGLKVYAPSGSGINDGSANTAVTIEGRLPAVFVRAGATNWLGLFTANS